jgi:hypothetical protein
MTKVSHALGANSCGNNVETVRYDYLLRGRQRTYIFWLPDLLREMLIMRVFQELLENMIVLLEAILIPSLGPKGSDCLLDMVLLSTVVRCFSLTYSTRQDGIQSTILCPNCLVGVLN